MGKKSDFSKEKLLSERIDSLRSLARCDRKIAAVQLSLGAGLLALAASGETGAVVAGLPLGALNLGFGFLRASSANDSVQEASTLVALHMHEMASRLPSVQGVAEDQGTQNG